MPTIQELRNRVSANGGDLAGLNADQLMDVIAKTYVTDDTALQLGCMLIGRDSERVADFDPKEWIMEPKVDDVRMQMQFLNGRIRLVSRGRAVNTYLYVEKTDNYPQYHDLYDESLEGTVLDGGMVMGLATNNRHKLWKGNKLFDSIGVNGALPATALLLQQEKGFARFVMFDIVRFRGKDVTEWLLEKRRVLMEVLADELHLDILPRWERGFEKGYEIMIADGAEGAVFKKRGSKYSFSRSTDWARVKRFDDRIVYIGGHGLRGLGRNADRIGSVSVVDEHGSHLGYVGSLTDEDRIRLTGVPNADRFTVVGSQVNRQVLIRYNGINPQSGLRHARIIRWADEGQDLNQVR